MVVKSKWLFKSLIISRNERKMKGDAKKNE